MSLRIAVFSHWYDPEGGAAAGPGTIARALRDRGHDVHVVTGFPHYPAGRVFPGYKVRAYQREVLDGVTVHRSAIYPSHDARAFRRAANYLSYALSGAIVGLTRLPRVDVSLVYSTPATAAIPAMALRALRRVPYVVQIQDMWPQTVVSSGFLDGARAGRAERILQRFCDAVYRRATTIAVTSPGMRTLVEDRGVAPAKIEFVPNWADESSFRPGVATEELLQEFGQFRPFTAMYAGNFGELQALHHVIDAARLLQHARDIGFVLVGTGVTEQRLRAQVAEFGLDNVRFVPAQPFTRMSDVLALGDVQLISLKDTPLLRRTLPSKVQANLSAGRPVVGAVGGDAAAVIRSSGAGLVAPPEDPEALGETIMKMARLSAEQRGAMASKGRDYYLSNFSEQAVGDHLSRLLEAASRRRGRR